MGKDINNYEPIHMGCFLSDPYITYAGASWISLFEHTSSWITLHLLCASEDYPVKSLVLSRKNRERLVSFVRSYGHNIVFYDADKLATPEILEAVAVKEKAEKAMKVLHKVYTRMFLAQNVEMSDDDYEECIKMAARGFGIIKTMVSSPDMKFEPANIVFRFPKDGEI